MRPDVRRAATATLGIAVIFLGANAVRMSVDRARAQALTTVPPGAVVVPYTVVLSEVVVGTSGAAKPGPSQTWALRSDGASALKIGDGEKSTRLLRFPDGTRIEVSDWLRAKRTVSKPYERPRLRDPRKSCAYPLKSATAMKALQPWTWFKAIARRESRVVRAPSGMPWMPGARSSRERFHSNRGARVTWNS